MGVLIIFPLEWLIVDKRSPAAWDVGSPAKSGSYYKQLNCVRGQASHSQVFCVISEGVVRIKLPAEAGSSLLRGLPIRDKCCNDSPKVSSWAIKCLGVGVSCFLETRGCCFTYTPAVPCIESEEESFPKAPGGDSLSIHFLLCDTQCLGITLPPIEGYRHSTQYTSGSHTKLFSCYLTW